ncbi:DinB superfamily protein [Pedobacter steynii]|uniref:DinB superfamily protein n=1 Tax=Pedobacter steynii TaxID=430522 RepID=A0A1G9YNR4_9SPHI|nr:DinB family protein [Pedobacter steynii]NQX39767.1 DinB family protein [Pedobacter steynii]SDN10096.1 DinB superfamily protein [Pedobacter steynii]
MNKEKIAKEMEETMTALSALLSSFSQEEINRVPFEGSWTAGQVARHLMLSNSGFLEILFGPDKEADRPVDQKVEQVKADFLNFTTKMQSPDFVLPKAMIYDKTALLDALEDIKAKFAVVINTLDLSKICMAFELPGYGYFTRWEAIYFVIYHNQRHSHQLGNIFQKLKDTAGTIDLRQ